MRSIVKFAYLLFAFGLCGGALGQGTFPGNGPERPDKTVYAIKNVRLFIEPGKVENNAVLLFAEGKILKAGAGVAIPENAVLKDGAGMFVYPSFIELVSDYGIKSDSPAEKKGGSSYESARAGAYAWNDALKTDFQAARHFQPEAEKASALRKNGFGYALSHRRDGILRGTAALVSTGNSEARTELLLSDLVSGISFQKGSSKQNYPTSLTGAIALIRQTFLDAAWYETYGKNVERNISLEQLNRFKKNPFLFEGRDKYDLLRMAELAKEFGLNYIVKGNGDEYQRLDVFKDKNMKIILPLSYPKAPDVNDPYDAMRVSMAELKHWENAPFNALMMHKAGIRFALTSDGLKEKEKDKFLEKLRQLVKMGIPREEVLAALTSVPASWLGSDIPFGTLKPGAPANFFMSYGDVFDDSSIIVNHWIQGVSYPVNDIPEWDVRGTYRLQIPNFMEVSMKLGGSRQAPKAEFKNTADETLKGNFNLSGKRAVFTLRGKDSLSLLRMEGLYDGKTWTGSGITLAGKGFNWTANQTETYKPETPKKETDKQPEPGKIWYPQTAYGFEKQPEKQVYLLKNGTVWTGEADGILNETDVLLVDGKINKIGKNLAAPSGAIVIDASGKHITAGIVDEHSHIALTRGVNEAGAAISAEVRMGDVINADDPNIYRHLAGGVTTIQQLHGSANPIGGQSSIIKMRWGKTPEELRFENAPGFIKFALGENVKQSNWGDRESWRYPQTRLGVEQFFMDEFLKAKAYEKERKSKGDACRKDLRMETLLEILKGTRYISCHSYVQSEITMLIRVADSLGFKVNTFTHILEGYKVADKMKAHGANASTFSDWWAYKMEVNDAIPYNAAILTGVGVNTAINSDDAEMARRLNQEAGKMVKYGGLSKEQAWNLVTINPAKMLHIDKRVGSIQVGKDADIVIWSAEPLSIYARAEKTFVDGLLYFDRDRDVELRQALEAERTRIIAKMLRDPDVKNGKAEKPADKKEHHYHCDDVEDEGNH